MTFIEAAIEILKQNDNQPMSAREIWSNIELQSLVKTNGKTPWASLNTILIHHSRSEYKNKIYFNISSQKPLKFTITDLNIINSDIEDKAENINKDKISLYSITCKDIGWKKLTVYNNNNNIEYEISDCEEYTYIIEDIAHATIKIGKTKNDPEQRLNQLRTGNPTLNLIHVFPSIIFSEQELHNNFNDFQKDLEWFFYTKGLKNFLNIEIEKHNRVLISYKKKLELEEKENKMFEIL